jgi:hypothetical protein
MIAAQRLIVICFVAIGLLVSGCRSVNATPAPGPTPTPFPLRAAGWEDFTVHTLCLEVDQSYPNVDGKTPEPIFATIQHSLAGIGVQVVAAGASCDATLTVTLVGQVSPVRYFGDSACTNWSQIVMKGEILLSISGRDPLAMPIYQSPPVPERISSCMYDEPNKAPFRAVWPGPIIGNLAYIWGPLFSLQALENFSCDVVDAAQQDLINWGPAAKEAVPALIRALASKEPIACYSPARILRAITGEDFGTDAARWQAWWEQQ